MSPTDVTALDAVVAAVALLVGYLVGSIPLAARVARAAGHALARGAGRGPDAADVWARAGPGPGMLALAGDLAKGVVPVAVGIVTWSWSIGWVAGLGAVLGACWPAFGRLPGGRGIAVLGGAAFTLAPPAGTVSVMLALLALGARRLIGRNPWPAAIATGLGSYPLLLLALWPDGPRVASILVLYLVVAIRHLTTRGR